MVDSDGNILPGVQINNGCTEPGPLFYFNTEILKNFKTKQNQILLVLYLEDLGFLDSVIDYFISNLLHIIPVR
jgi:hypothetical protein